VVEDDVLVSMTMTEMLEDLGYEVLGPAASRAEAMVLIDRSAPIDAALLDLTLQDGQSYEVAARLARQDVALVFVSGRSSRAVGACRYPGASVLPKPFSMKGLADLLSRIAP
jgi:DNA-binding response OmpR family regulator